MKELVSSEKEPFEMQTAKTTIDLDEPVRHAVVVGVFSLAHELDRPAPRRRPWTTVGRSPIGRHRTQRAIAVRDQPEADLVIRQARRRRSEDGPDKVVVEERRSHGELRLLEREQ